MFKVRSNNFKMDYFSKFYPLTIIKCYLTHKNCHNYCSKGQTQFKYTLGN